MFLRILFLMTIIPIIELYLMIKIHDFLSGIYGGQTALLISIFTILVTGFVGAKLMKQQGLGIMADVQNSLAAGQLPQSAILEGILVLIGGGLLLTPGYFTDVLGLMFLFPLTRKIVVVFFANFLEKQMKSGRIVFAGNFSNMHSRQHYQNPNQRTKIKNDFPDVIDIEAEDLPLK